ncbi:MAG: hypothetical protein EXS14_06160 [Planctomycetes bacterium]|nr:hypothetical protein [Planctomycetota bacterium]
MTFLRFLLRIWISFGRVLGIVNLTVLLSVVYLLIVPFYALAALIRDPLGLRSVRRAPPTHWKPSHTPRADADNLWRPY